MISKIEEFEQIHEYRVNGFISRARAIHIEHNEKVNTFLTKKKACAKN
jgi:hypothetical protein